LTHTCVQFVPRDNSAVQRDPYCFQASPHQPVPRTSSHPPNSDWKQHSSRVIPIEPASLNDRSTTRTHAAVRLTVLTERGEGGGRRQCHEVGERLLRPFDVLQQNPYRPLVLRRPPCHLCAAPSSHSHPRAAHGQELQPPPFAGAWVFPLHPYGVRGGEHGG